MDTPNDPRTWLVDKVSENADFRARLLRDPKETIGQELCVALPASLSIKEHEEHDKTSHLVLLPASRLNEGDLQVVTGGRWSTDTDDRDPRN